MSSLQVIEKNVLRDSLLSLSDVTDIVGAGNASRILWEYTPQVGSVPLPYINLINQGGGYANDAQRQDSDSIWRVVGNTSDMPTAEALASAIGQLHRLDPIVANVSEAECYTWITEIMPEFYTQLIQKQPVYEVGGIYRLRLVIV